MFFRKILHFYTCISDFFSTFAAVMRNLPTITRYLLIANIFVFLVDSVFHLNLWQTCGLFYPETGYFRFWQPLTYMFLHADFGHLFFNMFAVLMFAPMIEREFGARRFAIYYLLCGLGAALVQELVWMATGTGSVTIGASGAVFGILFAFGWLFPNIPMFLLFIPIPIRARVFVIIYAVIELMAGISSATGHFSADHVAHFAHLGGFLFGWLIILYWKWINWREPRLSVLWDKIKGLFRRHTRLDSTNGKDFDNYHYHKRV